MPVLLLGVSGGIAVYKAVELTSLLRKRGWEVRVVMTENATRFVTPLTFQTMSRHRVHVDQFALGDDWQVEHIDLVKGVDLAAVVPASANGLAKLAHGIADDLLSTTLLALRCPLLVAPAMNTAMWEHPATRANLDILRARGVEVIAPQAEGELACGDVGAGKLATVEAIAEALERALRRGESLQGRRVLVTAGGTREPIDPVRYVGNRSSGKMGHAIAEAACARGAEVTLVTTAGLPAPAGAEVVRVATAAELQRAVEERFAASDVLVMAAAVADYRPVAAAPSKIKKSGDRLVIELEPTVDVLASLAPSKRADQLVVGFAAETDDVLGYAAGKLARKGLDLIVANDVSRADIGFESDANAVTVLDAEGVVCEVPRAPKTVVAARILDVIADRLPQP
ncbi:bifunctional phosphopantothenoylcysteine decarboxylase/phosphopantothenate--cysteine ligase CoaBC [bacterium]|nr:bifunctional phosphopantothenoylcysteine decarboxylase/phosphopantothenate--cysteine ligase CoaBC [bacterium]